MPSNGSMSGSTATESTTGLSRSRRSTGGFPPSLPWFATTPEHQGCYPWHPDASPACKAQIGTKPNDIIIVDDIIIIVTMINSFAQLVIGSGWMLAKRNGEGSRGVDCGLVENQLFDFLNPHLHLLYPSALKSPPNTLQTMLQ